MLKVGLTGGIASGKSTVVKGLARLGARVLDADEVAREVVLPGRPAWTKLREVFGSDFFQPDQSLNRNKLRRLIFTDPEKRSQLNNIVHPEVMREIQHRSEQIAAMAPDAVLVVDVPLLLEVGAADRFDRVVVVYANESVQIDRLMKRDGLSFEEATEGLGAQMPLGEKVGKADYVIDNSGTREETQAQIKKLWQELLELARKKYRDTEKP